MLSTVLIISAIAILSYALDGFFGLVVCACFLAIGFGIVVGGDRGRS